MPYPTPRDSHFQKSSILNSHKSFIFLTAAIFVMIAGTTALMAPGAIYTTDGTCSGVNINIFSNKDAVFLNGGPSGGGPGLPDGTYYVRVTEPGGTILGQSPAPVAVVSGGAFVACYQLAAIVNTATSGFTAAGYDDTSNSGGEYKVLVSLNAEFPNSESKSDNFKVKCEGDDCGVVQPPQAILRVFKFYDANANGAFDPTEPELTGWKIRIQDFVDYIRFTPVTIILDPDEYTISEFAPDQTNWVGTTPNPVFHTLADTDDKTVRFGNVCLGAGGGLTLGFWSNKNGEKTINDGNTMVPELTLLSSLNLRNASGAAFDPANYAAFRTWILGANATNMAYMLSAQFAAMTLNVESGKVGGGSLIYAPSLLPFAPPGMNALGFISINDLLNAANASLGANGSTFAGSADRAYQEALKNALDKANNNTNFVQATPCQFTFPD